MYNDILKDKPFNLNSEQIKWVEETMSNMTLDEKIGQLFLIVAGIDPNEDLAYLAKKYKPGGFMHRPMSKENIFNSHKIIQDNLKIPAFLAANTEEGGDGLVFEGTNIGSNMQVASTNDKMYAYKQGMVAGKELRSVGGNLSFAPVVDINIEFKNPITNIRAYSDNAELVSKMSVQNVLGTQEAGAGACVKHFPGDGVDSRDQHVLTSMNHLNLEEWTKTFGRVYSDVFEAGALATMVGHFVAPNLINDLGSLNEGDEWVPTSFNKTILNKLLREKMKFNGLVLTDSTLMTGMTSKIPREEMVPLAIANGCDMFLFVKDIEEDYQSMKKGYEKGILTAERLDKAVLRILATKASLNLQNDLHINKENLKVLGSDEHKNISKEVSEKSITLIKNEENLFPFSKEIKKIMLVPFIDKTILELLNPKSKNMILENILNKFKENNIDVVVKDYESNPMQAIVDSKASINSVKEEFDAIIYISNKKPTSNTSSLLIDWKALGGVDTPWLTPEIKSGWISLGSPYHLFDAPNIKNFINAYSSKEINIDTLFKKLMGEQEFIGVSPVKTDVRYPNYKHVK